MLLEIIERVKQLTEEYVVAVEICQHRQVAGLLIKICGSLVELYERDLEIDERDVGSMELELIDFICRKLRKQSELVLAYSDVLDFVSCQDFLCLQVLLGARLPADSTLTQSSSNRGETEVDRLASILRKSVYLLCSINQHRTTLATSESTVYDGGADADADSNQEELLLDKSRELDRIQFSGFPIYLINTGRNLVSRPTGTLLMPLSSPSKKASHSTTATSISTTLQDKLHNTVLDTDWFRHFLTKSLVQRYPVDRVPVLVAIWQVAERAKHSTLERLIGQLIDQVAHEEANSCSEEELLQLSQTGSFWLTWRKRYQQNLGIRLCQSDALHRFNRSTTLLGGVDNHAENDADTGEESSQEEEEEEEEEEARTTSSDSSSSLGALSTGSRDSPVPPAMGKHDSSNTVRLRHIIDRELMRNGKCVICGQQPSGAPYAGLNGLSGCRRCGFEPASHRCALSFRPLALVGLRELLKMGDHPIQRFALISPNEWARQMLQARRAHLRARVRESHQEPPVGEHLLVGKTFERLTVVRHRFHEPSNDSSPLNEGSNSPSSSSDDAHSDSSSEQLSSSVKTDKKPFTVEVEVSEAIGQLRSFAASVFRKAQRGARARTRRRVASEQVSLSGRLMNFVMNSSSGRGADEELALCTSDLLLVDIGSPDLTFSMKPVIAVTPVAPESVWICGARSIRSGLPVGCFQLFDGSALIKLGLLPATCKCPLCGQTQLSPVRGSLTAAQ